MKRFKQLLETQGPAGPTSGGTPMNPPAANASGSASPAPLAFELKFIICDEPISALDVSHPGPDHQLCCKNPGGYRDPSLPVYRPRPGAVKLHFHRIRGLCYLGSLVELGDSDELHHNPKHPYTQALLQSIPIPDPKVERAKKPVEISGELPSPLQPAQWLRLPHPLPSCPCERCAKETPQLGCGPRQVACFLHKRIEKFPASGQGILHVDSYPKEEKWGGYANNTGIY